MPGDLNLKAPLMDGVYDEISILLDLSWRNGHISVAWYEADPCVCLTTRDAPSKANWVEIDPDRALLWRFEPCPDHNKRDHDRSSSSTANPDAKNHAKTGRPRPPLIPMHAARNARSSVGESSHAILPENFTTT